MSGTMQTIFRSSMYLLGALLIATPVVAQKPAAKPISDYTHNVDPFIGVDWGGNTFVGSRFPMAWSKLVPTWRPSMAGAPASVTRAAA
jgi:hypothetical protein